MLRKLRVKLKQHIRKVLQVKTSDHAIALGFAVGIYVSIIPTPGLNVLLGLLIVMVCKSISKISMLFALAIFNSFTLIPVYYLAYHLGDALLAPLPVVEFELEVYNIVYLFSRRFLLGNLLIASVIAPLAYYMVRVVLKRYRSLLSGDNLSQGD